MAEPVSWFIITTGIAGTMVLVTGLGVAATLTGIAVAVHRDRRERRERRAQEQQVRGSYLAVRGMLISLS
jgi:hypothetical protein